MNKALSTSGCRVAETVSSIGLRNAFRLLFVLCMSVPAISCVAVSPPGDVTTLSVSDAQKADIDTTTSNTTESTSTSEASIGVLGPVRWGGTIAKVHNKPNLTILEIVSRPLLRSGRPKRNDSTDGRFLAEIDGFLDPEILKPGRDISVIGIVKKRTIGKVGEADYTYPVVSVSGYRFWKPLSEITSNRGYPYYFSDDRFWRGWPHRRRASVHGQFIF